MIKRIQELAKQARYDSLYEKYYLQEIHKREISPTEYQDIYDKKFAELIVRECARALDDKLSNPNGASMAWCDGSDLLEHFGVEE